MAAKGYPPSIVDEVIAALTQQGAQSDGRFAEAYVRSRSERGYGCLRIRHELQRLGVEPELGDCDWDVLIAKTYAKKYRDTLPLSPQDQAARERFLIQRGFGYDEIRRLFKRLRQNHQESPPFLNDSSL